MKQTKELLIDAEAKHKQKTNLLKRKKESLTLSSLEENISF